MPTAVDSANNYFTAMNTEASTPNGSSDSIDAYYYSGGKVEMRANAKRNCWNGHRLDEGTTISSLKKLTSCTHCQPLDRSRLKHLWRHRTDGNCDPFRSLSDSDRQCRVQGSNCHRWSLIIDNLLIGTTWADVTPTPEPTTIALSGLGMLGLVFARRMRR